MAEDADTTERKEDCSRGTIWTDDEIDWLRKNYHRFPGRFCAEYLRRSYTAVRIMICRIKRSRNIQVAERQRDFGNVSRLTIPMAANGRT